MAKERERLEGLVFEHWEVLEYINKGKYKCRCLVCNKEKDISGYFLKNGTIPRCTCTTYKKEIGGVQDLTNQRFATWTVLEYAGDYSWRCRCDCGAEKIIKSRYLINGEHLVCSKCSMSRIKEDLTGRTFGEWTVLSYDTEAKQWKCRCSCGVERLIRTQSLTSGMSKSCGHSTTALLDLTGKQFGEWTVLKYIGNSIWKCKCSCGTIREIDGNTLRRGLSKSCGHSTTGFKDLTGQQFGEWKVLEYCKEKLMWKCECSCGNIGYVSHYSLLSKKSTSCGHDTSAFKDITGVKFGNWTALSYDTESGLWLCLCDCGTFRYLKGWALRNNKTLSCGCKAIEVRDRNNFEKYGTRLPNQVSRKRTPEQIQMISSKDSLIATINSFDHLPKTSELADITGSTQTGILWLIKSYGLENLIDIGISNHSGIENIINNKFPCKNRGNRDILDNKEIGLYYPDYKFGIEVNDTHFHSEIYKTKKYHQEKSLLAASKGVYLMHIFEYEWEDENFRNKIIKLIDRHLNLDKNKVYHAKDCVVQEIDSITSADFLNKYHLQNSAGAAIHLGLYSSNNELLGVMTFGKPRFDTSAEYELIRLAWADYTVVSGGSNKLFEFFKRKYNPTTVISYCDISKFTGQVYTNMGFEIDRITDPNYVWVQEGKHKVLSRYQTQKSKLLEAGVGTEEESESEIMLRLGYIRVYDSGNIRYIYRSN